MRCKPPYPSPPRYSSPPSYGSPSYPDFQLYEWDLVQQRQIQNNNLSSDSDYFSSSTYRANDNYKGNIISITLPPGHQSSIYPMWVSVDNLCPGPLSSGTRHRQPHYIQMWMSWTGPKNWAIVLKELMILSYWNFSQPSQAACYQSIIRSRTGRCQIETHREIKADNEIVQQRVLA